MAEPLTDEELARIEAYCEAATPGPWEERRDYGDPARCFVASVCGLPVGGQEPENHSPSNDRDFIVAARTDLPHVAANLRELREAVGPFQRLLEAFSAQQWGWANLPDHTCVVQSVKPAAVVTLGDLRCLAACLPERGE